MLSSDNVVEQAKKYSPLAAAWWVVLIQGLVVGALGIYLWMNPDAATRNVGKAVALYLYSVGLVDMTKLRLLLRSTPVRIAYYRAVMAAVIGGICVILLVFDFGFSLSSLQTVVWLLGLATLIYGLIGLYLAFTARQRGSGRLLSIIASVMFIALGFATVFLQGRNVVDGWIAPVLVVLGVGLIALSIYRYSQSKGENEEAVAAASTAAAAAASSAAAKEAGQ